MNNIIEKHISKTQKRFKRYFSLILKSKYDRNISDELIQTYIDARYYNFGVNGNIRFFYRRIYDALIRKSEELVKNEPRKKLIIENTVILFQYFFYFDYVRSNIEVDKIIALIAEKRITRFKLRIFESDAFIKEFTEIVKADMNETKYLLELYDSNDFEIQLKKVDTQKNNFYFVNLSYNFDFPKIFSKEAIEEVFSTDIIGEDRLFVEYPMITNIALKDILSGNFNKIYIADFAIELLKKKKKLEQLLEILENQATQDKIYFQIKYKDFLENKSEVYMLIKRGFKFALITDDQMPKLTNDELKILDIFGCIVATENDINKKMYEKSKLLLIRN